MKKTTKANLATILTGLLWPVEKVVYAVGGAVDKVQDVRNEHLFYEVYEDFQKIVKECPQCSQLNMRPSDMGGDACDEHILDHVYILDLHPRRRVTGEDRLRAKEAIKQGKKRHL